MVYLAWDLNLKDIKQMCINAIEFASIEENEKEDLRVFFKYKWEKFLAHVRGKFWYQIIYLLNWSIA